MGLVTVTPKEFTFVFFDNAELVALLEELRDVVSLGDVDIVLDVQEEIPFGRAKVTSLDPVGLYVESGALEDPLRPRQLSPASAADILGVLLLQARDLRTPGFAGPAIGPDGDELSQPVQIAWDTYCVARAARALAAAGDPIDGYRPQVQRRRYTFRTRHGFSDLADDQFARLWAADGLTWPEIVAMSELATRAGAA